jgi:hypothetical protein
MRGLIEDLADHTRVRLGNGLTISPEAVSLQTLVSEACEDFVSIFPGRSFNVIASGPTEGTWDAPRLLRVLSNLLVNAMNHGDRAGGVTVRVDGSRPDIVRLAVHNFGPPIAPAMLPVLFDPLTRCVPPNLPPVGQPVAGLGLGLGLFVVREIVSAHRGTVGVRSTVEEGTSFEVELPRHFRNPDMPCRQALQA